MQERKKNTQNYQIMLVKNDLIKIKENYVLALWYKLLKSVSGGDVSRSSKSFWKYHHLTKNLIWNWNRLRSVGRLVIQIHVGYNFVKGWENFFQVIWSPSDLIWRQNLFQNMIKPVLPFTVIWKESGSAGFRTSIR